MALDQKALRKIAWAIAIIGLLALFLIGVFRFNNPFMFISILFWMTGVASESTGMNIWMARMIAIPFAAVITIGVMRAFSWNKRKQIEGLAILSVALAIWSGAMLMFTKDFAFDVKTGRATRCFAVTPTGYEYVPCDWKVHPSYGTPVQPLTREIVNASWNKKNGVPIMETVAPSKNLRFFSPDGAPLVWYYQHGDGRLEFFSQPGLHPQMNKPLSAVTPEIISLMFRYIDERASSMVAAPEIRYRPSADADPRSGRELEKLRDMLAQLK